VTFLERAAQEPESERVRRAPRIHLDLEWVREGDPQIRRREFDREREIADRLESLKAECVDAREAAARGVGAADVTSFLAAGAPVPVLDELRRFEVGAIEPLDETVGAASRERRGRSRIRLIEPDHPADEPVFRTLIEHEATLPAEGLASILRRLGAAVGADPDLASGPRLVRGSSKRGPTLCGFEACGRPVVVLGGLGGPGGLVRALGAFGEAARGAFVRDLYGDVELRFGDPAFAVASRVLFRRLVLNEAFRAAVGLEGRESLVIDVRLEEALAPRLSWTYLLLATRSDADSANEAIVRATGRTAYPLRWGVRDESDPCGAAELRGTVLGILMEERLLCSIGRNWFESPGARRFLQETWEAEWQETAESVASALDLGTIEPTPILDRCRP